MDPSNESAIELYSVPIEEEFTATPQPLSQPHIESLSNPELYADPSTDFEPENDKGNDFVESEFEEDDEDMFIAKNVDVDVNEDVRTFDSDGSEDDNELRSLCGSDEDNDTHFHQFNPKIDMEDPKFCLGQLFATAKDFRRAIKEYHIKNHRNFKFIINDKNKIRAVCDDGKCKWVVYASTYRPEDITLQVKTLNSTHTCGICFKNKNITATWLGRKYLAKFREDPNWSYKSFKATVYRKQLIKVSIWIYYRARKVAIEMLHGSEKQQYNRIWDYCEEIRRTNVGSTVVVSCDASVGDMPVFKRMYMCFAALKKGFTEGCRPIIGLDGCHLKGQHNGQLLAAVGIDGNNQMFPIAWAVVEVESHDSWYWFLEKLIDDMQIVNTHGWTFITDKQKGLVQALQDLVPNSEHRHCVRHLYNNFAVSFRGLSFKHAIWGAARATTKPRFKAEMSRLKEMSNAAYTWMAEKDPKHWTRSHFSTFPKCDMLLNNMCEAFNHAIKDGRDKPVISLMEHLREYMIDRMEFMRKAASKWRGDVSPKVLKVLEANKLNSNLCITTCCGNMKFEVRVADGMQYVVDLNTKSCACRKWQLTGIPCSHAISAMHTMGGIEIESFVDDRYKKESYLKTYTPAIQPINGHELWPSTGMIPIEPPKYHKQPGRPKKKRRKEPTEMQDKTKARKKLVMKCGLCFAEGHNKRTCKQK